MKNNDVDVEKPFISFQKIGFGSKIFIVCLCFDYCILSLISENCPFDYHETFWCNIFNWNSYML